MKWLLSAIVLALITAALSSAPASAGDPARSTAQEFRGVVHSATGEPIAGATVEFAVAKFVGDDIHTDVFASTVSDTQGEYFAVAAVPGADNRQVEVMVTATYGDQEVHHVLMVGPTSGSRARSASNAVPAVDLWIRRGAIESRDSSSARMATFGDAVEPPPADVPDDDLAPWTPRGGATTCSTTTETVWEPQLQDPRKRRFIPVQRVTTRGHSKQEYEWETTSETDMEVAFTGDGGSYSGGLTGSVQNASSLGMKLSNINGQSRLLKVEWEFVKYQKVCVGPCSGGCTYYLDVFQWRPYRRTSGSQRPDNEPSWECDGSTTVNMSVTTWVARSSRVVWDGFFQIGGVRLKARQANSDQHKLTVTPDPGEVSPKVCGDGDYPPYANRVKERLQ